MLCFLGWGVPSLCGGTKDSNSCPGLNILPNWIKCKRLVDEDCCVLLCNRLVLCWGPVPSGNSLFLPLKSTNAVKVFWVLRTCYHLEAANCSSLQHRSKLLWLNHIMAPLCCYSVLVESVIIIVYTTVRCMCMFAVCSASSIKHMCVYTLLSHHDSFWGLRKRFT